jgi:four helix bundle protein
MKGIAMDAAELRTRTKQFSLRVIRLVGELPGNRYGEVFGRQLLKSGTSIGANYREALRASSRRHFASTLEIACREADETHYWLELLAEAEIIKPQRLAPLLDECDQLIAILTATIRSTKRRGNQQS